MNDLIQLNVSTQALLFGVFPVIIIAMAVAYGVKQWRDGRRAKRGTEDEQDRREE